MHTKFQSENRKERDHLGGLGIHGRIILKWILKKQNVRMRTRVHLIEVRTSGGFL
jgi:hypothetical protein